MSILALGYLYLVSGLPPSVAIAGVQLGSTSTGTLIRRLGRASVLTGQHPNSRHYWTLKGGLCLTVDGWEHSSDGTGYVVDVVALSNWRGTLSSTLAVNHLEPSLALLSPLRIGMTTHQVSDALGLSASDLTTVEPRCSTLEVIFGTAGQRAVVTIRLYWDAKNRFRELVVST